MIVNEFEELSPSELQKIKDSLEELKKFSELYCTGCNYCSDCPQNIKISKIFNYLLITMFMI